MRFITPVILTALVAIASHAQAAPYWIAERGTQKIVLAGISHLTTLEPQQWLDDRAWELCGERCEVWFEANPANRDDLLEQASFVSRNKIAPPNYVSPLAPEIYDRIAACSNISSSRSELEAFRLWYLYLLAVASCGPATDRPLSNVDNYFIKATMARGHYIRFLEKPVDQIEALASLGDEMHMEMIEHFFDSDPVSTSERRRLAETHWVGNDPAPMFGLMDAEPINRTPAARDRFIGQRNRQWLGKLNASDRPSMLVIVGLSHLHGPDSLPDLLQRDGYKVSFISAGHNSIK